MFYFQRKKTNGVPHQLDRYGLLSYKKSLICLQEALHQDKITYGMNDLMRGLLKQGSVIDFPAGEGINYKHLIKNTLDSGTVKNALIELSNSVPENTDVIFGIQNSGVVLANVIGFHLRKRADTIFKISPDKFKHDNVFGVLLDSYTKGNRNVLFVDPEHFGRLIKIIDKKTIRVVFVDDICDTGTLLCAVTSLLKNVSLYLGINIKVVKLLTMFERVHTNARAKIKKATGLNLKSVIKIEDLGKKPNSWIKIYGLKNAVSFYNE